jgi:hypothetical protein
LRKENLCIIQNGANVTTPLNLFADVRSGYSFRGSVPEAADGEALAVQMRDIDALHGIHWPGVIRTRLEGRRAPDWLRREDILFAIRGTRNIAAWLGEVPGPAVASQYFFLVRVRDPAELLPEFLAWQINQPPAQRYLGSNAEGTDQLSIRRGVLEGLPIAVPPLAAQQRLIDLVRTARAERETLERLIDNRERQLQAVVRDFLTMNASTTRP